MQWPVRGFPSFSKAEWFSRVRTDPWFTLLHVEESHCPLVEFQLHSKALHIPSCLLWHLFPVSLPLGPMLHVPCFLSVPQMTECVPALGPVHMLSFLPLMLFPRSSKGWLFSALRCISNVTSSWKLNYSFIHMSHLHPVAPRYCLGWFSLHLSWPHFTCLWTPVLIVSVPCEKVNFMWVGRLSA